jgi:hypothetical protein
MLGVDVLYIVANIDVKESEYDQNNFHTLKYTNQATETVTTWSNAVEIGAPNCL